MHDDYYPYKPGSSYEEEEIDFLIEETMPPQPPEKRPEPAHAGSPLSPLTQMLTFATGPLLMPAAAMLLIFNLSILALTGSAMATSYTLMAFGATCVLPVLLLSVLKVTGAIGSMSLETRTDRRSLYIIEMVALAAVSLFLKFKHAPDWMWYLYSGAAVCALVNFIINFKMKISCQASALAAMLAVFMAIKADGLPHENLGWWAIGTVLIAGFTGSLAVLEKRHTVWEVLAGYATGFICVFLASLCAPAMIVI